MSIKVSQYSISQSRNVIPIYALGSAAPIKLATPSFQYQTGTFVCQGPVDSSFFNKGLVVGKDLDEEIILANADEDIERLGSRLFITECRYDFISNTSTLTASFDYVTDEIPYIDAEGIRVLSRSF